MELVRNEFKHALAEGQTLIGLWSSLCSNIAAEVFADSGFDWILLDTEHSPNEIPGLLSQLQALSTGTASPIAHGRVMISTAIAITSDWYQPAPAIIHPAKASSASECTAGA